MSVVASTVSAMDLLDAAAVVLASREVAPAAPSDLTQLLEDADEWDALALMRLSGARQPLTRYLIETVNHDRISHWRRLLDNDVRVADRYQVAVAGRPGYPARLAGARGAPPILFVRGRVADRPQPTLAIVGSRDTDHRTLQASHNVAARMAGAGLDVVSGLAFGIDAAAHRGALTAGRTTAVLGSGIMCVFPAQHARMAEQISQGGVVISEFAPYAPPTATSFLWRNGTIAALSDALLVMDAAEHSGSRQAVRRATELGRPVLIWAATLQHAAWARELVVSGQARFVRAATDVQTAFLEVAR